MLTDKREEEQRQQNRTQNIFISYAHEDEGSREKLCKWLDQLEEKKKIVVWSDKEMRGGDKIHEEIRRNIEQADIFLLLLSVDSLGSKGGCRKEYKRALELKQEKGVDVVPIPVRTCDWRDPLYGIWDFKAPHDGEAIDELEKKLPPDRIWHDIQEFITEVVEKRIELQRRQESGLNNTQSLPVLPPLPVNPTVMSREYNKGGLLTSQFNFFNSPLSPVSRKTLLAAMLVGQWRADSPHEMAIITELADVSEREFRDELESFRLQRNPFIHRRDNIWRAKSSDPSAFLAILTKYLGPEILDRFEEIAARVLPNIERYPFQGSDFSSICYSDAFKKGISDMIALLATHGDQDSNWPHSYTIAGRMSVCVRKILASEMLTEKWVALDNYLPLLAEAAPDEFLNTIEKIISENPTIILGMFKNGNSPPLSGCRHAGLLWALECLCWHPNYLLRSVKILADLFQQGADSSWENKPISLMRIFLPWIRNIAASEDDKMEILDKIITQKQEVAWHLLYSLMPGICTTSTEVHRPKYREWGRDWKRDVLLKDYHRYTAFIADRFLDEFKKSPQDRAEKLLDTFTWQLPQTYRQKAYQALQKASGEEWPNAEFRISFGRKLGKMIRHHRQYPDAKWSLPEEELKMLDNIYELVISGNLIERHRYLFDETHPDIPDLKLGDSRDNYRDQDRRCEKMRIDAVVELWHAGGWDNIQRFAVSAVYSNIVGRSLAKSKISKAAWSRISECLDSENKSLVDFARGFVFSYAQKTSGWAKNELSKTRNLWSSKRQASFVLGLLAGPDTLMLLKNLPEEAKNLYWREHFSHLYWKNAEVADVVWVIEQLNAHGRPAIALGTAGIFSHGGEMKLPSNLLADTLELLKSPEMRQGNQHLSYSISVAIQILQRDGTLDDERLANIEWEFFDEYAKHKPITLGKKIVREPEFLANLIAQVYYPKDAEIPEGGLLESENARQTFDILQYFGGSALSGHGLPLEWDDAAQAKNWAREVCKICAQNGREEPGDLYVGKILSNTGDGADGIWPSDIAREVLEDLQNSDVEDGMVNGRLNQRGVVWRSAKGGGEQENELADNYEKNAESLREKWPRAAKVLRELSESYRWQARREDNRRGMDDF